MSQLNLLVQEFGYDSEQIFKYFEYKKYLTFEGVHPLWGTKTSFVFNFPCKHHQNILDFSDNKWWYSKDAGLNWEIISRERYVDLIHTGKVDMVINK